MFASFLVTLRPTIAATIGNATGKSLHGLFFNLLEQHDRALFEQVHAAHQLRPLTVSPLLGDFTREGFRRRVLPSQVYAVRYTTLSDDLFNALSKILLRKFIYRGKVSLDGVEFAVQDVAVEPDKSRDWGRLATPEEIWEQAKTRRDVSLRFVSPTAFNQNKMNLLFPVPRNVFHAYREKWNAFTHLPIGDEFIAWVEQNVAVEAHSLETRMVWFSDFQKHGFVGWVRFIAREPNPARLRELNALADFAFFAGTGIKTPMGMGQTRRLLDRESERAEDLSALSQDGEME
jgi:CRISPR-associated endoribonuclease Cas6